MAKYFANDEIQGLVPELVEKLDALRERAGIPVIITCGRRTIEENARIGGVPHSAHEQGLAVDIRCSDSFARFRLLEAAFAVGFKRIGVETLHIHLDLDTEKVQQVAFLGISK